MGLIAEFQNLINEHSSSSILRERLLLFKDKFAKIEEKSSDLQKELADLQIETAELRKQLKEQTITKEYTEYMGAFFKRKPSGGYNPTVYCPSCRMPMSSFEGEVPYVCSRCNIEIDFTGHDLPRILNELSKG